MKRIALRMLFWTGAIMMAIAGLEILSGFWIANSGNPAEKAHSLLQPDRELGWKLKSHLDELFFAKRVQTNQMGFRGAEFDPSAKIGLQVFGPSSAFGWGVAESESYTSLTGKLLGLRQNEIQNLSQIGYSSAQGVLLVKHHPPRPDALVVVSYGINDLDRFRFFFPTFTSDAEFFSKDVPFLLFEFARLRSKSNTLQFLLSLTGKLRSKFLCSLPESAPKRVSNAEFEKNLDFILKRVTSTGSKMILVDTPYLEKPPKQSAISSDQAFQMAYQEFKNGNCEESRKRFQEFLSLEPYRIQSDVRSLNHDLFLWSQRNGVPLLKASELLVRKEDFVDPIHPSEAGHLKIANALFEKVTKMSK